MDFDSLPRRDLQFFCKMNKIPANMTNIAMADALKTLDIVEGIDEFMNQSEFTRYQSPTSVAKNLPSAASTAARTTRRKTTKDDTQSSDLVTRSCLVTSKSLSGEMDQENKNMNMLQRAAATSVAVKLDVTDIKPEVNVSKTPAAARSTRRAQAAASSKKDETVQRVYSTRRSVRLLEESMADLSLKTKESLNVPSKKNAVSPAASKFQKKSNENLGKTEEAEVLSVRDLNDSWEKEWDCSKNDPDLDVLYGDLGDITFSDAITTKEKMNVIEPNTVIASQDSFVIVDEQETLQDDDFVVVDQAASTTITNVVADCNKESESEQMKIESESESESEGDDFGVAVNKNQEAAESKVSATEKAGKVDSVSKVLIADVSKEESKQEEEEICESGELIDSESEEALVSEKKKTQVSPPLSGNEIEVDTDESEVDSDEWSDFDTSEVKLEENSCESTELVDNESEEAPASSSLTLSGKETKTLLSPFEAESILESEKNMGMVVDNNGEGNADAEAKKTTKNKKKKIDEESFKDVSLRQLTKILKELDIKSKQQHKCAE